MVKQAPVDGRLTTFDRSRRVALTTFVIYRHSTLTTTVPLILLSQATILEGRTNIGEGPFGARCEGSWTKSRMPSRIGPHASSHHIMVRSPNRVLTPAEKGLENAHFIFCNPFQNLRLGCTKMITKDSSNTCAFLTYFSAGVSARLGRRLALTMRSSPKWSTHTSGKGPRKRTCHFAWDA